MKPYYDHKGITIYHGDCRDILPELEPVDLVLTDPPYGARERVGKIGKERGRFQDYLSHEDTETFVVEVCSKIIINLIERYKRVVFTPGAKNLWFYPRPDSIGAFYQPAACSIQRWGQLELDPILFYGEYPHRGTIKNTIEQPFACTFLVTESVPKNGHPCPKPIQAWKKLMLKSSTKADTILDPFMGSGTTLVAAKQLGRKAIGIEIEEKYVEIAIRRLSQEMLPFNMPVIARRG